METIRKYVVLEVGASNVIQVCMNNANKSSTTRFGCTCIVLLNYWQRDKVYCGLRRMIVIEHKHAQRRDLKQGKQMRHFLLFSMLVFGQM